MVASGKADALRRLLAAPIAHRGLHACGAPGPVENSIGAARAAIAAGFGIECDIQLSRDGEAMVFHDAGLDRLTGATGRLADHDAAALAAMTLGAGPDRIPTLAAFLDAIAGRAPLVIEIKSEADGDPRLADRALALLESYDGVVALESFDPAVVARCHARGATRPIGLVGPPETGEPPDAGLLERCDFASWNIDHLAAIAATYPRLPRTTWTVRTPKQQDLATRQGAQIVFEGFTPAIER